MRPPSTPAGFGDVVRRFDIQRLYTRRIAPGRFAQIRRALDDLEGTFERAIRRGDDPVAVQASGTCAAVVVRARDSS